MPDRRQPLAAWYDLVKTGLRLVPLTDPAMRLAAGEELYVCSRQAKILTEEANPLFEAWQKDEAPWEKEGELRLSIVRKWDTGRLYLTSERFVWVGNGGTLTFRLQKVNSAYAEVHRYFCLLYGLQIYKFRFQDESILKWLTYTALVAKRIEQAYRHQISLSNY